MQASKQLLRGACAAAGRAAEEKAWLKAEAAVLRWDSWELRGAVQEVDALAMAPPGSQLALAKSDLAVAQAEAARQEEEAQLAWGELEEYKRHMAAEVAHARQEATRAMRAEIAGPLHSMSLQTVVDFSLPSPDDVALCRAWIGSTSASFLCCPIGRWCDLLECMSASVNELC